MSKRDYGNDRVNILKKVKVGKIWNFYPAVVEPNGKLRDKVLVRGRVEADPEGCDYIEWRKDRRKHEPLKDRVEVVDRPRPKAIEFAAKRAGIETVRKIGAGRGYSDQRVQQRNGEAFPPP